MCKFWLFLWKESHYSKNAAFPPLFQMETIKHANKKKKVEKMRCEGGGEINKRETSPILSFILFFF